MQKFSKIYNKICSTSVFQETVLIQWGDIHKWHQWLVCLFVYWFHHSWELFLLERDHHWLWRTELFCSIFFYSAFTYMSILLNVRINVTLDICFNSHFRVVVPFLPFAEISIVKLSLPVSSCLFLFCQEFGLFNVQVSNMYKVLKNNEQIITQKLSATSLFHFQQINNRLKEYEYINKILTNKKWLHIIYVNTL